MSEPRTIYLAASLETMRTSRYDGALALIAGWHPGALILSPRELFASNADWLAKWPVLRPSIEMLYLLTAVASPPYIARGCLREWWDVAGEDRKPCVLLDRGLVPRERFRIEHTRELRRRWPVVTGDRCPRYGRRWWARRPAGL